MKPIKTDNITVDLLDKLQEEDLTLEDAADRLNISITTLNNIRYRMGYKGRFRSNKSTKPRITHAKSKNDLLPCRLKKSEWKTCFGQKCYHSQCPIRVNNEVPPIIQKKGIRK